MEFNNMSELKEADNSSTTEDPAVDVSSDDFFNMLDESVNGMVMEEGQSSEEQVVESDNKQEATQTNVQSEIETLKKRYADSSKEGKKLNSQLRDIEPYMPILDAMKNDPNLVNHVKGYFEGGGQTPGTMKERLGLDEDFVFDPDEAINTPNSDSAKVLEGTVDGIVQKRLNTSLAKQRQENSQMAEEKAFKERNDLTPEQWSEFVGYAKQHKLSLDDILYIKNKDSRDSKIASDASRGTVEQIKKVQQIPQSIATAGSGEDITESPEDKLFDSLLGIDKQLEEAFL